MSKARRKEKIMAFRSGLERPANENSTWKPDDQIKLLQMFKEGKDISYMAIELERSERGIYQKLDAMGCYQECVIHRNRFKWSSDKSSIETCACYKCKLKDTEMCTMCNL